jgi:hypothetical protein
MRVTVSDAELLAMAVMSALLGFRSERRRLRHATARRPACSPSPRPVRVQQASAEDCLGNQKTMVTGVDIRRRHGYNLSRSAERQ